MPTATRSLPSSFDKLDHITLGHLLTFRKVYEERSFNGAAAKLGTFAANVKKKIESLQGMLDEALFVPSAMGVVPTAKAVQIMGHVGQIILIAEQLHKTWDRKQLVVGFCHTISARRYSVIPHLIDKFSDRGIQFHVRVGSNEEILQGVLEGEIDVAIVMHEALNLVKYAGLAEIEEVPAERNALSRVFFERTVALVSAASGVATRGAVPLELIRSANLLFFKTEDMPQMSEYLAKYLNHFRPRHEMDDWESLFSHVLADHGLALVPDSLNAVNLAGVKVLPIDPWDGQHPAKTLPVWKYAIVRHASNARPIVIEVEDEIARQAKERFPAYQWADNVQVKDDPLLAKQNAGEKKIPAERPAPAKKRQLPEPNGL